MENQVMHFYSKANNNIVLRAIPGHFATSHSHINYYVDMTMLKTRCNEASAVAKAFVQRLRADTVIDTIVCMDGCEVIGAYMAEELERGNYPSMNKHKTVYIVSPEFNSNNQMIFRDNLIPEIAGKNILLLLASTTTGLTVGRSLECIAYYGGIIKNICSVFSAITDIEQMPIESIFTTEDVTGYQAYEYTQCPFCKNGQKLDALVNGYGYSKL
ncbi:MAG: orotate phosphoribosyltransferase [Lachnospiraceae bacterium]